MSWESFIKSRFATFILGAVLILVMLFAGRAVVQKYEVDKEIFKLQSEVDKVHKNNDQLSYLIKYFDTPEYQEKQAREKLNLKKDGEFVVVLPDNSQSAQSANSVPTSNTKLWFNYFFGQK